MMGFQHSGRNDKLIELETEMFNLTVIGKAENKKFKQINANLNISGFIGIDTSVEYVLKTIDEDGELLSNSVGFMRPSFFEDGQYQFIIEDKNGEIDIDHQDKEIRESFVKIGNYTAGNFSFSGDIGYTTFYFLVKGKQVLSITLEVFPSKLDYIKDYKEILSEVNEEIASMVFDYLGKTFTSVDLKDVKEQTGVEFTEILKKIFNDFEKSLYHIIKNPKHAVLDRKSIRHIDKSKNVSKESINYIRKNPHLLQPHPKGIIESEGEKYLPLKVMENNKVTTIDIYENQFVKQMILNIVHRIKVVQEKVAKYYGQDNAYHFILTNIEGRLRKHLNGFFSKITTPVRKQGIPLAFRTSVGYREIFYNHMLLKKGLDISQGLYQITPKKLWNLYEIWCYIKLHKILKELGFRSRYNGIIEAKEQGITLTLVTNKESKVLYQDREGKNLELWYNRKYSHLPTTNQRPDTVLCLQNPNQKDRMYIFDAKYRLNIDSNGAIGPVEEDINVMHRYRDAIVSEFKAENQFQYHTFGAYVMFPYSDEEAFTNHRYYKSINMVNIGAFPMLPGSTELIKNHIKNISEESYLESTVQIPTHELENDYHKFKNTNVMVVNVLDASHMAAYVKHKFYHIPKKKLANIRMGVEYVAFYMPKSRFKDRAGIEYYGKIKEIYTYKRKECKELETIRNNPEDLYLRLNIEWFKNVGPITPVEYGVELINYTTQYLLENAETMHELSFGNRKEIELYKKLKKIQKLIRKPIIRRKDWFSLGGIKIEIISANKLRVDGELCDWEELEESFK